MCVAEWVVVKNKFRFFLVSNWGVFQITVNYVNPLTVAEIQNIVAAGPDYSPPNSSM